MIIFAKKKYENRIKNRKCGSLELGLKVGFGNKLGNKGAVFIKM